MSYAAARTAIKGYLEGMAGLTTCHEYAPATLQDLPCAVIIGPEVTSLRGMSFRTSQYDMLIRFFVSDQDLDKAHAASEAFKETLIPLFDTHVAIGGEVAVVSRQWLSRTSDLTYGRKNYQGFDLVLSMEIDAGPAMSP